MCCLDHLNADSSLKVVAHPILTCAEALAFERDYFASGIITESAAMNRAGRMLGQAIMRDFREITDFPERPRILVLAGKGHNAGDAIIAADEVLRFCPYGEVHVVWMLGEMDLRPNVTDAFEAIQDVGKVVIRSRESLQEVCAECWDVCIDGILGMQFRLPLSATLAKGIESVNAAPAIALRVAVDLPSGIGDNSGTPSTAFKADITYAAGIAKSPLFAQVNAPWLGRIRYLDIGFFDDPSVDAQESQSLSPRLALAESIRCFRRMRPTYSDKRRFGHAFIVAGSRSMPGAALMAVQAALRSGVGLVTAWVPESLVAVFAAQAPEAMWMPLLESEHGEIALEGIRDLLACVPQCDALLIGPGMGRAPETRAFIAECVQAIPKPIVLDADALFPECMQSIRNRDSEAPQVCLTPHVGEFKRIQNADTSGNETLLKFSREHRVAVLLKGAVTTLTDGEALIYSPFGNPVLARGGSGDVLAGLIVGLRAQPQCATALDALGIACVWHGLAADALARSQGQTSATILDVLKYLPKVIRDYEC